MSKWPMVKVRELFTFVSRGKSPDYRDNSNIKVLNQACVFGDGIILDRVKYQNEDKVHPDQIVLSGDILVNSTGTGTLGRCCVFDINEEGTIFVADSHLTIMRPNNDVISSYFKYFMMREDTQRKLYSKCVNGSTNQIELSKEKLLNFLVPLPPLDEQRKIAATLDAASELLRLRKEQLAELDKLVKSQFIEMFGNPLENSKSWMTKPLGELCVISRGGSPRPIDQYLGGTVPWIKIGDATTGDEVYLRSTREYIIEEGVRRSRRVKAGSLIFANCGVSLGFARIITFDGCIHDGWLSFEDIDERLDKVFLLKSLNHCTDYFRKLAPEGTQPNLNTGIMKGYVQIVPPLELQNRFTDLVRQVDKSKFVLQQSLEQLEMLKKSLMQKYFA